MKLNKYNMILPLRDNMVAIVSGLSGKIVFFYKEEWEKVTSAFETQRFSEIEPDILKALKEKMMLEEDDKEPIPPMDAINDKQVTYIFIAPENRMNDRFFTDPIYKLPENKQIMSVLENLSQHKDLTVILYGADCFTKEKNQLVSDLLVFFKKGKIPYYIMTTGQYADQYIDLLDEELATINIRMIPDEKFYRNINLSYQKIWENILKMRDAGLKMSIFVPFDEITLNQLPLYYQKFHYEAMVYAEGYTLQIEPVENVEDIGINTVCHQYITYFNKFLDLLYEYPQIEYFNLLGRGNKFVFYNLYKNRLPLKTVGVYCEAYSNIMILDLYGNIYKCLESSIDPQNRIGTYDTCINIDQNLLAKWEPFPINDCQSCIKKFVCRGGCTFLKNKLLCGWEKTFSDGFNILFDQFIKL